MALGILSLFERESESPLNMTEEEDNIGITSRVRGLFVSGSVWGWE